MLENSRNNFPKKNKLKGVVANQQLFSIAKQKKIFPLKAFYSITNNDFKEIKFGVSAPKKIFKRAVDRNFVKRLMREAIRKNKNILYTQKNSIDKIMIIYISNTLPNLIELEQKIISLFTELNQEIHKIESKNIQTNEN
jgi:ribonuclease P protein component